MAYGGRSKDHVILHVHSASTSFVATGLHANANYRFRVSAKNEVGRGAWSSYAEATTRPASERPAPPEGPTPATSTACDAIVVNMPQLRTGCASDTSLALDYSLSASQPSEWRLAVEDLTDRDSYTVSGLLPGHAYIFRARARNAQGMSEPSANSPASLTAGAAEVLRNPPTVEALSSSAYRVSWAATSAVPCDLKVLWRLDYRRTTDGVHAWHTLIDNTALEQFEPQIRCPNGCTFRVTATNLAGWQHPSVASEPVSTRQLHPPAHGAVRLELHLPSAGDLPTKQHIDQEIAKALQVADERVHCVEVRDTASIGTRALIFDLVPSHAQTAASKVKPHADGDRLWSEPDEETMRMAQELALQLLDTNSILRSGAILSQLSSDAGLTQLGEDGETVRIGAWVPPPASPPPPPSLSSSFAHFNIFWVFCIASGAWLWRRCSGQSRRGYAKVGAQNLDQHGLLADSGEAHEELELFDDCDHLAAIRVAPAVPLVDVFDHSILDDVICSPLEASKTLADAAKIEAAAMAEEQAAARASAQAAELEDAAAKATAKARELDAAKQAHAEAKATEEAAARRAAAAEEERQRKIAEDEEAAVDAAMNSARTRGSGNATSSSETPAASNDDSSSGPMPRAAGSQISVDAAVEAALQAALTAKALAESEVPDACEGTDHVTEPPSKSWPSPDGASRAIDVALQESIVDEEGLAAAHQRPLI